MLFMQSICKLPSYRGFSIYMFNAFMNNKFEKIMLLSLAGNIVVRFFNHSFIGGNVRHAPLTVEPLT